MRLVWMLLLVFATSARAVELPKTPAGKAMAEFLDELNTGKLADEPRWARWFALAGPLRVHSVTESKPHEIRIWTRGEMTGNWLGLHIAVKPEPPHEIDAIGVTSGLRPDVFEGPPLTLAQGLDEIDAYLTRLAAADFFSGAVLVAKDGAPLYEKAFGWASKRYGVPNAVDTRFKIASITKLLVAVSVAQLADAGKLSFQDPVKKHLPDYPTEATIHQLLTHTAGLGRGKYHTEATFDRLTLRTAAELLPLTIAEREFAPGTDVRYNNEAWVVLAAIVEKISGMDWHVYLDRHVYARAGMTGSGSFDADREVPNVATGYTRWRWKGNREFVYEIGERRNTSMMSALRATPSGNTFSTVRDLHRLMRGIETCALVTCATRDLMLSQQVVRTNRPGVLGEGFGYGTETWRIAGVDVASKSGSTDGTSTRVDSYRQRGYIVVVLSNYDGIGEVAANAIGDIVLRIR